jgi:hypothetical protein
MDVIRHRIGAGGYRRHKGQEESKRKECIGRRLAGKSRRVKAASAVSSTTTSVIAFHRVV